jgi:hypothetical protein
VEVKKVYHREGGEEEGVVVRWEEWEDEKKKE